MVYIQYNADPTVSGIRCAVDEEPLTTVLSFLTFLDLFPSPLPTFVFPFHASAPPAWRGSGYAWNTSEHMNAVLT